MNQPGDDVNEVLDPSTTALRLAQILSVRPELASVVATHPNAYRELLEWIVANADPGARLVAQQRLGGSGSPPTAPTPGGVEYQGVQYSGGQYPGVQDQSAQPHGVPLAAPTAGLTPPQHLAHTPGQPAAAYVPTPDASGPRGKGRAKRKGLIIGIVAGATALALAGGAFAVTSLLRGGAASPEGAVERLIDGVVSGDVLALAGVLAPSERDDLSDLVTEASAVPLKGTSGDGVDYLALATSLRDVAEPRLDDLVLETEQIADGVVLVRAVSGTVALDGDPGEIAAALTEFQRDYFVENGYEGSALDSAMARSTQDKKAWLEGIGGLSWDIADIANELADGTDVNLLTLVAVDEGGWFISPLLSWSELSYNATVQEMSRYGDGYEVSERGDAVIEAQTFATPDDALDGLMDGVAEAYSGRGVEMLAAALPLPERRMLSLYGGYGLFGFGNAFESPELQSQGFRLEVLSREVTQDEGENGIALLIDSMTIEVFRQGASDGRFTITRSGWSSEYTNFTLFDDGYWSSLGVTEFRVVATPEGGGWQVDPLATLSDYGADAIRAYAAR